ncbi:MAG TPA: hypothetical protein VD978_35350 [Azospirillum sp.]|nr:hypothetical protein [Azospirillum sp.]
MSFKNESGHGDHMGWLGAMLVFAAGMMAAFLVMEMDWRGFGSDEDDALALRAVNTRPLMIVPQPRS